ncbi:MAG: hypothetical protein MI861_08405 [Pirellulales bacterium]|nr:hypothetical protein [Pirellulales bacterium]
MSDQETQWQELLDKLHCRPYQIALVAAGGGSGAIGQCFGRPGASRTFVEAVIPYSRASMTQYLGDAAVAASASLETAMELAQTARERASRLSDSPQPGQVHVGLALVAALPTDPPRRGDDRIHVVLAPSSGRGWQGSLGLAKDRFTRTVAEQISDQMIFRALAELTGSHDNADFFAALGLEVETRRG